MKVLLSVIVICFSLALCNGMCSIDPNVTPSGCVDEFDGKKHPFWTTWNTAECMECHCHPRGMRCCARYGGIVHIEGCTAVVDPQTCEYRYHKQDDPSKPCPMP
ncbi:small serum protein 2-like [Lacerta agilis]|uniref:small serum protein 2-like n=1 Tax=Lacerta agilis TaxID=80427 RepID=UPI00141A17D1|nr:small serum protein 2-like [Lacerta agilis]